jgi:hypothetical protein
MPAKKKGTVVQRRGSSMQQWEAPRQIEHHLAPPKQAERQHARPGAGIKRSRGAMSKKPR